MQAVLYRWFSQMFYEPHSKIVTSNLLYQQSSVVSRSSDTLPITEEM